MKKLFLILLVVIGCKSESTNNNDEKSKETENIIKEPKDDIRYVTAKSGLVYRNQPKGKRLGKIPYKTEVKIIAYSNVFQEVNSGGDINKGEWLGIKLKGKRVYIFSGFLSKESIEETIWDRFPIKEFPINEAIHPNKKKSDMLTIDEIVKLHLDKIYPDFSDEFNPITFYPSCLLEFKNLSDEFKVIVIQVNKETVSESLLIPYKNGEFIIGDSDFNNFLKVAYKKKSDGIGEIKSLIENNYITVFNSDYSDKIEITKTVYQIDNEGRIYHLHK